MAVLSATALALSGLGALASTTTAHAAPASDLMFSVYIEGSANEKAIEVYNPTAAAVDMSAYRISLYVNGKTTTQATLVPEGSLAAGGYYVITNPQAVKADLVAQSDVTSGVTAFNGNDVLTLTKGSVTVDSMGQLGVDPGAAGWTANGVSMVNMTLTKKACTVDTDPSDVYDPSVDYAAAAIDDYTTLGTLKCDAVEPTDPPTDPTDPPVEGVTLIGTVQGEGDTSPLAGGTVTVQGHVVGSFQGENQFSGYYVQDAGDDNSATSDGIFVYAPGVAPLTNGTHVAVTGTVKEAFGQTQIDQSAVVVQEDAGTPPAATQLTVPVPNPESVEGMLVTFPQKLTILEFFQYGRFGEIVVGPERQNTPTAVLDPGPVAAALAVQNGQRRLILDDGRGNQNPTPAMHPNGKPFTTTNFFRGGDKLIDVTGIMSYRNNAWKLQPTVGAGYTNSNPRPSTPVVGGDFTVASFNVLNYFTTLTSESKDARGADNAEEFERQRIKIIKAMAEINADVFGLMEIENNGTAVENLVKGLNSEMGAETYKAVNTGVLGSDAIIQAIIYKPATTALAGKWAAYDFMDQKNRPNLVQTFTHKASGEMVNVSINHLKSKGSACAGEPDLGDGAGNCNLTRTKAAQDMSAWLATDPTGQKADRTVIIGDLNSYDHEDPIKALVAAGYTDMMKQFGGEYAYSYVFDGQIGYLDHALANDAARGDITGTAAWHINADEATLFDYELDFKAPAEQNLWQANPYRSSDHDPVIIGLQMGDVVTPEPTPAPTVTVTAQPSPAPTVTVTATPAPPTGDLYETPGFHYVNGRKWMTTCEPYSVTVRCWTYIWGTQVQYTGGQFVKVNGWLFNNLTYVAAPRSVWKDNKLAYDNSWTAADGRRWRTECETALTGRNGCRSWAEATVIEPTGSGYALVKKFVFNNIVRFSN
ncbi:ExeM/NucH family extracellular endonuclease [Tessaracoccus antarcticus]|uniref:ExeM/NucH family extracellular endonuclease n=1 Tax=Tessaracoccus antarcticus TaxID=2479848 RepID=A0A3M0G6M8_9ACTN|nr:ExeM/NucH family extracellular endonuclease [Tessaracoccus antarcticus]